jgi:tetratricopeptide (TPR) repeat protein
MARTMTHALPPTPLVAVAVLVATFLLTAVGCQDARSAKSGAQLDATQRQTPRPVDGFETSSTDPPLNANTRFAAGQLAESQGDLEHAIVQYREALKLDPNHKQTLFRLGAVYTETRRFDLAVPVWQHYIKVTDRSAEAYNDLALCYERAGKLADAEQTYRTAIARDRTDATVRMNYGLMLARADRLDEATAQLQTVLKPAEVQYNLGSVFEQMGKLDEARARYRKALELDPKLVDARARLAVLK